MNKPGKNEGNSGMGSAQNQKKGARLFRVRKLL